MLFILPLMNLTNREAELNFNALNISDSDLNEAIGYGTSSPDEAVCMEMKNLLHRITAVTIPRFEYFYCDGNLLLEKEELIVGDTTFRIGKIIARQLRGSEKFVFFTATAGMEYENLQHQLSAENDIVKIYLADCIGSVIAEKTADYMEEILQKDLDEIEWKHTNRFSPGYCGWHVREQSLLFPLFPNSHPCGIQLTSSNMMVPIKSVSGVIGLGKQVRKLEYTCGLCSYEQCYKRKRPQK